MSAATAKKIALVTGANSGIGFELTRQLMATGVYHVLAGARSAERGSASVKELESKDLPGSVEFIHLDVTDDELIERAAKYVDQTHGKLDLLVNNAAIVPMDTPLRQQMRDSFDVNATGPAVVVNAFESLLLKAAATSSSTRIVNISSGVGSIGRRLDSTSPMYKIQAMQYRASKNALNMITACQFVEYKEKGIKVFAYDPGYTVSNLSSHNTAENGARSARESVLPLMELIDGARDNEAGLFLHNTGVYPW